MQKKIIAVCTALMLMLLCAACSNTEPMETTSAPTTAPVIETPAQIVEKMQAALEAAPCTQADLVMDMAMSVDAGELGQMDMSTKNTTVMTICTEPLSSYVSATAQMSLGGETTETVAENYSVMEDGALVSYVNSSGIWMKVTTGQTAEEYKKSISSVAVDLHNAAVDETVTQWQGKEVICLTTRIKGDALQDMLGGILDSIGENSGAIGDAAELVGTVDYSALSCDARIYLDPQTYLPVAEEMTFSGMSQVLAPLYEQMGLKVEITSCTAVGNFTSYEAQEEIKLPEGVAEKAEKWTRLLANEPDNGDGTFTIREGTVLIDITHPEGFEISEKDYDHVTFKRDDYREITYTIYYLPGADTTGSDFTAMVDSDAEFYAGHGGDVFREQGAVATDSLEFTCDILGLTWGSGREDAELYAWTPLASDDAGTYYLLAEVSDGYSDGMGGSKNADITFEEFTAYLNAAVPSTLMD